MPKFLIDVNLPYYFALWRGENFIHQRDLNDEWDDSQIWDYARRNNLTIVTKDVDFSNRIMFRQPPPRVIHIRFGNLKMRDFFQVMSSLWLEAATLSETHKLVNIFKEHIEAIE